MSDKPAIDLSETRTRTLQKRLADVKFLLLGVLSPLLLRGVDRPDFSRLRTYCSFVGHGRSGSSLVGALLNAHPNVVMSNELNGLRRLRTGLTARQLYRLICLISLRQVRRGSKGGGGYGYAVPGQWQGSHKELLVIGDRKAGATAYEIVSDPGLLMTLDRKVRLDKKFIHVIRNPFDTIATTCKYTPRKPGEDAHGHLSREIRNYFARCTAVRMIEQTFGAASVHHLQHERLVGDPQHHLKQLCGFLNIEAPSHYLRDCASIINNTAHQSRGSVTWAEDQKAEVRRGMKECHWLAEYQFDS